MLLKDFVQKTLTDIHEGVAAANKMHKFLRPKVQSATGEYSEYPETQRVAIDFEILVAADGSGKLTVDQDTEIQKSKFSVPFDCNIIADNA